MIQKYFVQGACPSPTKLGIYGCSCRYVPRSRERAHSYDCVITNGIWDFNSYDT